MLGKIDPKNEITKPNIKSIRKAKFQFFNPLGDEGLFVLMVVSIFH